MKTVIAALLLLMPLTSTSWARDHSSLQRSSFPGDPDLASPASSACPHDAIVWINPRSGVYYLSEEHAFGRTIQGAYMCRTAADQMGYQEHTAH